MNEATTTLTRVLPHRGMLPGVMLSFSWALLLGSGGLWACGRRVRRWATRGVVHGCARCAARRIVHMSMARRARSARPPWPRELFARSSGFHRQRHCLAELTKDQVLRLFRAPSLDAPLQRS